MIRLPNIMRLEKLKDIDGLIAALHYDPEGDLGSEAAQVVGDLNDMKTADVTQIALNIRSFVGFSIKRIAKATISAEDVLLVRLNAVKALGRIGDSRATNRLIELLTDKNEPATLRSESAKSLGEIKDKRAVQPVIGALTDSDPNVCRCAAQSLGKIGDPSAINPLISALDDNRYKVSHEAAKALRTIGTSAIDPLLAVLEQSGKPTSETAAQLLGEIGWKPGRSVAAARYWVTKRNWAECVSLSTPSVEPLIAVLSHNDSDVRLGAVNALGKIGDKRAIKPVTALLKDKDELVRRCAAQVLHNLGA